MFDFLKAPQTRRVRRPRNVPFVGSEVLPGTEEFLGMDGSEEEAQRAALTVPSAFGAASNVAKLCAQHDPHVGRQAGPDEKPKPQKNHPFERAMWRPNPWMSNTFLWWFIYTALPIRGQAFFFIEDGGLATGDVLEIWPIPPWRVKPVPHEDTRRFIKYYNYWPQVGADPIPMPTSNICWVRQPKITDLFEGQSSVSSAEKAIDVAQKQWEYRQKAYYRGGRPEVAIAIKKEVSNLAFNTIKRDILSRFGVLERGTLVHRGGDIDVKTLGMTLDELQLLQFQDHDAGVIKSLFGWNDALEKPSSYAHADVSWEVVAQVGSWPLMKLVAGALTTQVIQPRYGEDHVIYYDDIRPKRRDADRADYQVHGQDQTVNELREGRGLTPITTGPHVEAYNTIVVRALPAHLQQMAGAAEEEKPLVEPERLQVSDEVKADLEKWERKALRVLSETGSASAGFESEFIPAPSGTSITSALLYASTPEDVRGIFRCAMKPHEQQLLVS